MVDVMIRLVGVAFWSISDGDGNNGFAGRPSLSGGVVAGAHNRRYQTTSELSP